MGAFGCDHPGTGHPTEVRQDDAAAPVDAAAAVPGNEHCVAPEGVSSSPHSIADVVSLLNALPKPVTLPCFLESLARPLAINAAQSSFSAQPAQGRRSPRIFLFFSGLIMSVVPEGPGGRLLELGESRQVDRSLKAELEFPIEVQLDEAAPYVRLPFDDTITSCGFCHQGEEPALDVASPFAFVSPALRPMPTQRVPIDELRTELATCDETAEPDRCALLHALFSQRPDPLEHEFPITYKTFF